MFLPMCQSFSNCKSSMLSCFSTMSESVGEFGVLRLQLDSRRMQLEHVGYISSHYKGRVSRLAYGRKEGRKEGKMK